MKVKKFLFYGMFFYVLFSGYLAMAFELPIEAEHFSLVKGWKIEEGGYFPSQPNLWSLNVIVADETSSLAIAKKDIEVPHSGTYYLWVRYESCYGFGSVFNISIKQNGKTVAQQDFGSIEHKKYFPFNRGYSAQGPWDWHNTDFVYQGMTADLEKGPATIIISKSWNEKPAAKRVIDLLYLTDDSSILPGNDWNWRDKIEPPIISRFKKTILVRITAYAGPVSVQLQTSIYLIGYYKGPRDTYFAVKDRLSIGKPKKGELLSGGESTGWQEIYVSTVMPPELSFRKKGKGKAVIEIADRPGNIIKKVMLEKKEDAISIIVGIGKLRYEKGLLGNSRALTVQEILQKQKNILDNYKVSGRPAKKLLLACGLGQYLKDAFNLAISCGFNAAAYSTNPEIFGINPELKGFDTSMGALTVQNQHMTEQCYQGDFSNLEIRYKKLADEMEQKLGKKLPYRIKLIEESGPPSFEKLMTYPGLREKYVDYLGSENLKLEDVEKDSDISFYHQNRFRALTFAKLNAQATKLVEKYFPEGTRTNSGSFYPSTGLFATLARGDDPFLLFRERGVTEFSSEISWGRGGTPDYIGPQTQSYEAALARSLCKYHNCPMGSYLIADGNRGYDGDYVELASYPMYAQDFRWLHYYYFGWITECTTIGWPDVLKGIKRVSFTLGQVEDDILGSKLVPAKIAIGWSSTTDIWDLSMKPDDPRLPTNSVYPQERQNLYLLLRHLQYPVDILSEEDIVDGYLKNYDVFIFVGDHIKPDAALDLSRWVEDGGTLISVAGGGFFDNYNKPLNILKPVFGIKNSELKKYVIALRPKLELIHSVPIDTVSFNSLNGKKITFEIYGYRQNFEPDSGVVMATYKNGEPACIANKFGKGKAFILGFLPGASYFKPSIPLMPYGRGSKYELSSFSPFSFLNDVSDIFRYFLADIKSPVACSEPLVEAVLRKSADGYVIPLINYTGRTLDRVKVRLNLDDSNPIRKVETKFSGNVRLKNIDGISTIEIRNLGKFDCIKALTIR